MPRRSGFHCLRCSSCRRSSGQQDSPRTRRQGGAGAAGEATERKVLVLQEHISGAESEMNLGGPWCLLRSSLHLSGELKQAVHQRGSLRVAADHPPELSNGCRRVARRLGVLRPAGHGRGPLVPTAPLRAVRAALSEALAPAGKRPTLALVEAIRSQPEP